MDTDLWLATLLVGAAVGFLSGLFGKGGSAVATPLLHALGVPAMAALASPLPATIPSVVLAARVYRRDGHVDSRVVRVGLFFGVPATVLGAMFTRWVPGAALVLVSEVVLLALGVRILLRTSATTATRPPVEGYAPIVAVVVGVGLVAGLLGNAGGFLFAPLFVGVLRMPLRRALGTSLTLAALLAVPGTAVHAALGHIDWSLSLAFGLGAMPLAVAGARVALRMRERSLTLAWGAGLSALATGLLVAAH